MLTEIRKENESRSYSMINLTLILEENIGQAEAIF